MSIELIDKYISWHVEQGVVIELYGTIDTDFKVLHAIQVVIAGASNAQCSIPEVTITPSLSSDAHVQAVHGKAKWYIPEWYEETAKYLAMLSRIDLPCKPVYESCGVFGGEDDKVEGLSLTYRLSMDATPYSISIEVDTLSEMVEVSITINEQHAYGVEHLDVDTVTTTDIVTMDSLRALVKASLNNFMVRLEEVTNQVIVPEIGTASAQH